MGQKNFEIDPAFAKQLLKDVEAEGDLDHLRILDEHLDEAEFGELADSLAGIVDLTAADDVLRKRCDAIESLIADLRAKYAHEHIISSALDVVLQDVTELCSPMR